MDGYFQEIGRLEPEKDREHDTKGSTPLQKTALCRGRDSNPHELYTRGLLRPVCLPFHHLGVTDNTYSTKNETILILWILKTR